MHAIVSWVCGLRSAFRTRVPAFWMSWSDCLPVIQARNPDVAAALVNELEGFPSTPTLGEAASSARELVGVQGFEPLSWRSLAAGERPPDREPEELEPGTVKQGWQHEASSRVERRHRDEELFPRMGDACSHQVASAPGCRIGVVHEPTLFPHMLQSPAFPRHLVAQNATSSIWPSPRSLCKGWGAEQTGPRT